MSGLRRLLKTGNLSVYLVKAACVLGPGLGIGVYDSTGWRATSLGNADPWLAPEGSELTLPLCLEGEEVARLAVFSQNGSLCAERVALLKPTLELIKLSLEEMVSLEAQRREVMTETLRVYREMALLHRAAETLNDSLRLRAVAKALLDECRTGAVPAELGMVFLRDPSSGYYIPNFSHGPNAHALAEVAQSQLFLSVVEDVRGEIVNDLASDRRWRGECSGVEALLIVPLMSSTSCVGALVLAASQPPLFEAKHLRYISIISSVAGIAMGNALNFEGVQSLMKAMLQALAAAIDARDPFTSGHSHRVAKLGAALAKVIHEDNEHFPQVRFDENELYEIFYAGILHDVGKIGVREEVLTKATRLSQPKMDIIMHRMALWGAASETSWREDFRRLEEINKLYLLGQTDREFIQDLAQRRIFSGSLSLPLLSDDEVASLSISRGNLTPEERREIERHPAESYRILQHIPFPENMTRLLTIISQHHERLDGSGYPIGQKGEEILLQSRILTVVDIYDAVTMERHYKSALSHDEAAKVLRSEALAGKIDSRVVDLLCRNIEVLEIDDVSARLDF